MSGVRRVFQGSPWSAGTMRGQYALASRRPRMGQDECAGGVCTVPIPGIPDFETTSPSDTVTREDAQLPPSSNLERQQELIEASAEDDSAVLPIAVAGAGALLFLLLS